MSLTQIRQLLPKDEYDAIIGANTPSASNVFATMADVTGGSTDLASVLTAGNTGSAGQNIILTGSGSLRLDNVGGGSGPTCLEAGLILSSLNGASYIETDTCRIDLIQDIHIRTSNLGSVVKLQSGGTLNGIFHVVGNGEAIFQANLSGTNRTIQFQDASGTVAYLTDIDVSAVAQSYTITGGTPADRAFDYTSTNPNEIAEVLATLITDLKTSGIIL